MFTKVSYKLHLVKTCMIIRGFFVFCGMLSSLSIAKGADIEIGNFSDGIVIEGAIEQGDYDKLLSLLRDGSNIARLFLASPGGSVVEAMKIGELACPLRLETEIPGRVSAETYASLGEKEIKKNSRRCCQLFWRS